MYGVVLTNDTDCRVGTVGMEIANKNFSVARIKVPSCRARY